MSEEKSIRELLDDNEAEIRKEMKVWADALDELEASGEDPAIIREDREEYEKWLKVVEERIGKKLN